MYEILGNAPSAKFIFFAIDDPKRDLDLNEVKRLLGCKTAKVYKRRGDYRQSFNEINQLLNMRTKGVNLNDRYIRTNEKHLTHVVRVVDTCKCNSLLALQYSGFIVSWLVLDVNSLGRLTALLESIEKFRKDYLSAQSLKVHLLQNLKYTKKLEFLTPDKWVPSDEDINQIFEKYGEVELAKINAEISNWFDAARWDTILE
jgi:hypothetical protein